MKIGKHPSGGMCAGTPMHVERQFAGRAARSMRAGTPMQAGQMAGRRAGDMGAGMAVPPSGHSSGSMRAGGTSAGMAVLPSGSKRGIFLSLDAVFAMLLLFLFIIISFSYYLGSPQSSNFNSQLLRSYTQDAATVLSAKGYFTAPLDSPNNSDTSGIREVLRATPASSCMEVSAYSIQVPEGLFGYWQFDESGGASAADSSGYANSGTLNNTAGGSLPTFVDGGVAGRAMSLAGGGQYVNVPGNPTLNYNGSMTFTGWFRLSSDFNNQSPLTQIIMEKYIDFGDGTSNNDFHIVLAGSDYVYGSVTQGSLIFKIENDDRVTYKYTNRASWKANEWYFFAAVLNTSDNSENAIYINAVRDTQTGNASGGTYTFNINTDVNIGGKLIDKENAATRGGTFNGTIDDVRLYSRMLLQPEIAQLYSNPAGLLYSVSKPECTYSGGEIQALKVPFAYNEDQGNTRYYYAAIKTWLKGAR